ncbi:putative C2H2-type domain-containing protein [Seiridium cardinale]|uniref:C2H2-type domain-containing protein n=1 Tax=Seiridium cardinale TaxID=138064 RepID=A0ABR2XF17_9PEZI
MDISNPELVEDSEDEQPRRYDQIFDPSIAADLSALSETMDPQFHWTDDSMPRADAPSSQEDAFNLDDYLFGMDYSARDQNFDLDEWTDTKRHGAGLMYEEFRTEEEKATAAPDINNSSNAASFHGQEPSLQDISTFNGSSTIFDASFTGSQINNPARRRSRLMDTVSEAIKTLEQLAACWRCRILHQECDPGDPCKRCPSTKTKTSWGLISGPTEKVSATPQRLVDPLLDMMNWVSMETNARLHKLLTSTEDTMSKVALDILCPRVNVLDLPGLNEVDAGNYVTLQCNWILLEEPSTKDALNIGSLEEFADLLHHATLFEEECGDIHCLDSLSVAIKTYTEELSQVILREGKSQQNKRWWLSTFYSLCIQSHVRHGLKVIESQLKTPSKSNPAAVTASEYLQLAVQLFYAASSEYDPIALDWDLDDAPAALRTDLRLLKYYRQARKVVKAMNVTDGSFDNSYTFLNRAFEIGEYGNKEQPDSFPPLGMKRRANSPPSDVMGGYDVDPLDLEGSSSRHFIESRRPSVSIPPLSHAPDTIVPPPLPPPRYIGNPWNLPKAPRRSRNSSPASRTSVDYTGSPHAIARNISSDSLSGLPDNMNKWSLASHGSRSPASGYSGDFFIAGGSTTPTYPAQSSTMAMPISSPRRFSGASASSLFPELQARRLAISDPKSRGFYVCKCCPKRPKKFDTMEELSVHEAERQYECSYCGNRFKNKNEAERHENSLHMRRRSWSCSMLLLGGYNLAFCESTDRPVQADICGYCGEEFTRSGGSDRNRTPTEQDWDKRLEHLQTVHKFRECNSSKKFFRADHFRQHLKHSHAGTSGKWTSALENVCLAEVEPATAPIKST